ncbi:GNAT family N-acetyltransferase [Kangiella sp. HZ709]|uniref:GNAT family N-acetyltransferase n=1 Tax=Kangiella sp. HZ709 TaxID=2666328 RepID=UPI0012B12D8A|nr:GNAT family N-acetyltransferase [Kangiella sp. HZ709]MRX26619.1 GNAT family N-acetyltransferase [Kangiella sp. HZ709]
MIFIPQTSISNIGCENWPDTTNPLVSYEFLKLFETSGVVTPDNGWQALHLCLYEEKNATNPTLKAVIPSYIKSHSYGEYVFDWAWADFYHRRGLDYYPKLLSATPVTPCLAPKIIGALSFEEQQSWFETICDWCEQSQLSGWHINFDDQMSDSLKQLTLIKDAALFERTDLQFHWHNQGFQDFEEFLMCLKPKKRKNIRQERAKVQQAGWSFERVKAKDATKEQWLLFYQLYSHTFAKKSGWAQLNKEFFLGLSKALPDNCLLLFARKGDTVLAGALFFYSNSHLYGRYWGAFEDSSGLHFETCYYQGIEFAIENKLRVFEPGAQGEHKLARGFEPILTKSYHHISDQESRVAIEQSVISEKQLILQRRQYYIKHSAYKKQL